MSGNSIQYSSRTYTTILNDINAVPDLADKPEWFKRLIAGVGDSLSIWNNAAANQSFLRTAFTRQAVADLLALIDYQLTPYTTSSGTQMFYLKTSASLPITFTATDLKAVSQGSSTISSRKFEARSGTTVSSSTGNFTAAAGTTLTVASDFALTGHKIRVSTTGTLPSPLVAGTDYYVVYANATTISLATSLSNAIAGTLITFAGAGTGTHTWTKYSFTSTLYQQETVTSETVGTSDGATEWQTFKLGKKYPLKDTFSVTVNSVGWTQVTTLVNSGVADKHYKVLVLANNEMSIMFGNGTYGAVPPAFDVIVSYAVGGGTQSNVANLNTVTAYSGASTDIDGTFNATAYTGGADEQGLEDAKILGPLLLKARDRFVTEEDGESLAEAYGGLSLVNVIRNYYGVLTCKVVGIANGGGNPSGALQAAIQTYLADRTPLAEVSVTFGNATLTTKVVTIAVKMRTGYTYATESPYILLGMKMFFSETGKEIYKKYLNYGTAAAITLINTIFGTAFTASTDGTKIARLCSGLELFYRTFGDTIQQSDFYTYVQGYVEGIDYITMTLPSFPILLASDEITTHTSSTFNLSEVP